MAKRFYFTTLRSPHDPRKAFVRIVDSKGCLMAFPERDSEWFERQIDAAQERGFGLIQTGDYEVSAREWQSLEMQSRRFHRHQNKAVMDLELAAMMRA